MKCSANRPSTMILVMAIKIVDVDPHFHCCWSTNFSCFVHCIRHYCNFVENLFYSAGVCFILFFSVFCVFRLLLLPFHFRQADLTFRFDGRALTSSHAFSLVDTFRFSAVGFFLTLSKLSLLWITFHSSRGVIWKVCRTFKNFERKNTLNLDFFA